MILTISLLSLTSSQTISNECLQLNDDTCLIENKHDDSTRFDIDTPTKFKKLVLIGMVMENVLISRELLKNLESFTAKNCDIEILTDSNVELFEKLRELRVTKGILERISNDTFERQASLEILDLSVNKIKFLPDALLSNVKNLKVLDLHGNELKFLSSNFLNNQRKLVSINLSDNQLITVDSQLFKNKLNLKKIEAANNSIRHLDQHIFDGLISLVYLNFDSTEKCHLSKYGNENSSILVDLNEVKQDIRDECTASDFEIYQIHAEILKIENKFFE